MSPEDTGSAFGLDEPMANRVEDLLAEQPEEQQAPPEPVEQPPAEQEPQEQPSQEEPALDEQEPGTTAAQAAPEEGAQETEQQARTYAGKFADVDALERGYREAESFGTRSQQRVRELEDILGQVEQALPALLAQQQQQHDTAQVPGLDALDEDTRAAVQALVDNRVAQVRAETQAQTQATQHEQATLSAIGTFRREHPEVQPGSDTDTQIYEVMQEFRMDPTEPGWYSIALELANDPSLRDAARLQDTWLDTDEGLNKLRWLAKQGTPQQEPQKPAPQQQQQRAPDAQKARESFTERGPSAPPQQKQKSLVQELIEQTSNPERDGSVFFR